MNVYPKQNELVTPRGATEKPGKESRCKKYATRTGERLIPNESHSRLASANKNRKCRRTSPRLRVSLGRLYLTVNAIQVPQKAAQEGLSLKLKEKGEETEKLTESKHLTRKNKSAEYVYIFYIIFNQPKAVKDQLGMAEVIID